jgi:hypothetical protein
MLESIVWEDLLSVSPLVVPIKDVRLEDGRRLVDTVRMEFWNGMLATTGRFA